MDPGKKELHPNPLMLPIKIDEMLKFKETFELLQFNRSSLK